MKHFKCKICGSTKTFEETLILSVDPDCSLHMGLAEVCFDCNNIIKIKKRWFLQNPEAKI